MVKLNKIYTRTGDDGTTGLVRGPRRPKDDVRIQACGTVDEANSFIGLCRLHTGRMARLDAQLRRIQNDLFDLGADLATPGSDEEAEHPALRIEKEQIDWLEAEIDNVNENLKPLESFVLPGGSELAAALHVARTIVRRAERDTTTLLAAEPTTPLNPLVYLNRLSDLLFVFARAANDNGDSDVLWKPGQFGQKKKEK